MSDTQPRHRRFSFGLDNLFWIALALCLGVIVVGLYLQNLQLQARIVGLEGDIATERGFTASRQFKISWRNLHHEIAVLAEQIEERRRKSDRDSAESATTPSDAQTSVPIAPAK